MCINNNFLYILLSIAFLSVACSSDEGEISFPDVEPTNIRLKYLTTTEDVVAGLGAYAQGWDVSELHIERDDGNYPDMLWWYQYELSMRRDAVHPATHDYRMVRAETDGPIEPEEIKEREKRQNRVRIHDARLNKYPSLYVYKGRDNDNNNWNFGLYAHQVHKDGNKTTHKIYMSGGHSSHLEGNTPPPSDGEVVTAMLALLEEHD